MHITRVYADADGESHFDDVEVPLHDAGEIGSLSDAVPATGVVFRENPPDYDFDWHCAPTRQYIVLLDGEIEITVSDGEVRRFGAGEVLLVEDTEGKGHRTRHTKRQRRRSIFIALGCAALLLGGCAHVANSSDECHDTPWEMKTVVGERPFELTPDEAGAAWLLVGTDSGFEGGGLRRLCEPR